LRISNVVIDGTNYLPADAVTPSIGVAITTRNRRDVFTATLAHWRAHLPAGAALVVVDDASDDSLAGALTGAAVVRYEAQQGIARAKNAGIAALMAAGCRHLFLADDDVYPIAPGWAQLYAANAEPHLMYLFKDPDVQCRPLPTPPTIYDDGRTFAYSHPRGCLLYLDRAVVDAVGGMRPQFGVWGHEHVEYSLRIHNAGLTTNAFQDACGSSEFIHSMDEHAVQHKGFTRGVDIKTRRAELARNEGLLEQFRGSTDYVEYRQLPNLAITTLFTKVVDPQRGSRLKAEPAVIGKWLASLQGCTPVVLVDELTSQDPTYVRVPTGLNPYLQRWVSLYQYLRDHPAAWVWCTDGTDVEMLHTPWAAMVPGVLYVGHEPTVVGIPWLRDHHKPYGEWIDANADRQLVNAGVVGGDHATVLEFIAAMVREIFTRGPDSVDSDMAAFNYLVHSDAWQGRATWGPRWVTTFKANERNEWSCWRHK
jgi:glycosyltransferase involved in cell wall biosynthesis